ncbi:uncharacterized protein LOC123896163 [Trifolium pratense]|uniref:uncharacterized protein LOC123896163 n=1 Tax=Trifolium pratense TaxID=57577 RepID=UPI001E695A6E|nr:uncharacterized protein LOC123896163 [Trifolium pratense]
MWSWKLNWMEALDDADIESLNELYQLLEQVRPNRASSDRRRWSSNSDGSFSVRSTYMVLQDKRVGTTLDTNTVAALKRLWKNNVPSKVSVFGWRLLLEKLPTREALFCKELVEGGAVHLEDGKLEGSRAIKSVGILLRFLTTFKMSIGIQKSREFDGCFFGMDFDGLFS